MLGSPSAEQERFRKEVHSALHSLFARGASPGSARTYEATLRAIAPKVPATLRASAAPVESEGVFYACFAAVLMLVPKSPSSVTGQPGVRRSCVKLVKAAVAFWHFVRGMIPRMGALWAGIKRPRVRATSGK